jgi:hypothetical protein
MRKPLIVTFGIIAAVVLVLAISQCWNSYRRHWRQRDYEGFLADYRAEIKPGTTREELKHALHNKNVTPAHEPFGGSAFDVFIYVGQEHDLWYCNSEDIDLQFHFTPAIPGNSGPGPSDRLSKITLGEWPNQCL